MTLDDGLDELSKILAPKFDARLRSLLNGIDLNTISRVTPDRLALTAVPSIFMVELVSGAVFADLYDKLYCSAFHGGERERSELITFRLEEEFAGRRGGLAPYRIVGLQDRTGQAIGAAHFSVLFLQDRRHAVPYLQYIYIRREYRRKDMSEVLHTLVLAAALADAAKHEAALAINVPFTLFETEPAIQGANDAERTVASQRSGIHSKSGSQALMLRRKRDGKSLSAHVQPGLEHGEPPLTYIWALRANPAVDLLLENDQMGTNLVAAYYQSLRDEGFPEANIALAESTAEGRFGGGERATFCLMPLSEITRDMYVGIDDAARSTSGL